MDEEQELTQFFEENQICYDRFTFDRIFRHLLSLDIEPDDAVDLILINCALSALVTQERIDNEYYKRIVVDEEMSEDLLQLKQEMFNKRYVNPN